MRCLADIVRIVGDRVTHRESLQRQRIARTTRTRAPVPLPRGAGAPIATWAVRPSRRTAAADQNIRDLETSDSRVRGTPASPPGAPLGRFGDRIRSEERRVGKESKYS